MYELLQSTSCIHFYHKKLIILQFHVKCGQWRSLLVETMFTGKCSLDKDKLSFLLFCFLLKPIYFILQLSCPICTTFFCLLGLLSWLTALVQGTGCFLVAVGHTLSAAFHSWSASGVNSSLRNSNLYLVREHAEAQGSGFASRILQEG